MMDATHGTNNMKFPLATLIVVDDHGNGQPGAWFLSSRETAESYTVFLTAFLERVSRLSSALVLQCITCFASPLLVVTPAYLPALVSSISPHAASGAIGGKAMSVCNKYHPPENHIANVPQMTGMYPGWLPSCILIDASKAEIAAIRSVFGEKVKIFICTWHMHKAVKKHLLQKVSGSENAGIEYPSHD